MSDSWSEVKVWKEFVRRPYFSRVVDIFSKRNGKGKSEKYCFLWSKSRMKFTYLRRGYKKWLLIGGIVSEMLEIKTHRIASFFPSSQFTVQSPPYMYFPRVQWLSNLAFVSYLCRSHKILFDWISNLKFNIPECKLAHWQI